MNIENTSITPTTEKPTKPKRTDDEKLAEWCAKKDKLLEQQTAARKRGREIDSQLVKANSKIQEYENKELYKICKDMNITTKDIIAFLKKIPKGTTLDEIAKRAFHRNPEQLHL